MNMLPNIGYWKPEQQPFFTPEQLKQVVEQPRQPMMVVQHPHTGAVGVALSGNWAETGYPVMASLPPMYPEWLGNRNFTEVHGIRFPYASGAMANGIATEELVIAMANAGFLGFFGAAGLSLKRVENALDKIERALGKGNPGWGSNLIHSPNEPELEAAISNLYIEREVRRVSAAAYMRLTPYVLRYALTGITQDHQGNIVRKNYLFAKVSRPEVALHFMKPAPKQMVEQLLQKGLITAQEARLSQRVSVAEDYIIEADSGGHTDNQSMAALVPSIMLLRSEVEQKYNITRPIRLGAAGGLGTPQSVASAFALGVDFVLTGSINQACIESGLHSSGKKLLANVGLADVMMAPAADMFELGVEVQVLKRGSMFGVRAKKLYELYRKYESLEEIPSGEKEKLEANILLDSIQDSWRRTEDYWKSRDSREVEKANKDSKHKMALVFRSYLGLSSKWAIEGLDTRKLDYQIWCGPAMGAFNRWTKGSFLEEATNRQVVQVARNMMEGAVIITRSHQLRTFGIPVPNEMFLYSPRPIG
jgi:trans-AT polyketide synthase, acyltransferase and oxidoreductase domains